MSIAVNATVLSLLLYVAAYVPYFWSLWRRTVEPAPVSWLMWGTMGMMSATIVFFQGGGPVSVQTLASAMTCLIIGAIAAHRWNADRGHFWKQSPAWSYITWILSMTVYAFYCLYRIHNGTGSTGVANTAVTIYLIADLCGLPATIRSVWFDPKKESLWLWTVSALSQAAGVYAVVSIEYATLAPFIGGAMFNLIVAATIVMRRRMVVQARIDDQPDAVCATRALHCSQGDDQNHTLNDHRVLGNPICLSDQRGRNSVQHGDEKQ